MGWTSVRHGPEERYAALGLPPADVQVLVEDKALVAYYDATVAAGAPPKQAANWLTAGQLTLVLCSASLHTSLHFTPHHLASLGFTSLHFKWDNFSGL